ncbi:purine transporter [Fimicolochytrium jonesii]|uniref:purine transporter n=1 Tax=Fimicolochytrium jonesii TaxID=1396493 RepID=UPI0022FED9E2|nr:purine transporter [Fimicolochytrium jonesii]KAI8819425.1 purine transporter [Fimicolochytrium jonesii]
MGFFHRLNASVAGSPVGKWFKLEGSGAKNERIGSNFTTEMRAGLATFVTMAYIISVNATILSDTGGTCGCTQGPDVCLADPVYQDCLRDLRKDLITATSAIATISTFAMGLFANLPLALAPGLGVNAYFAYTVVGFHGTGKVSYQTALAAVFIEGLIFLALSLLGLRQLLTKVVPLSIKTATAAGIGLFLAFIGLQSSEGIGIVGGSSATLVTLGGCPPDFKDKNGACTSRTMESPTTWVGILGFIIIAILMSYRVKGSLLIGIVFISAISWFRSTSITYFPYTDNGNSAFDYFKQVVDVPKIRHTAGALDFNLSSSSVWIALVTMLYVDILDTTGSLFSMAKYAGLVDEHGDFEGSYPAFITDAASISIGSLLGTSPNTVFIESGAGIAEGGKTGLTAIAASFFFFLSLFFAPIFASFPPWATGPALILVGVLMAQTAFADINWRYLPDAIPAFLTIAIMPMTYSIAYGLIAGLGSYIAINGTIYLLRVVSGGRLVPADKDLKEQWGPEHARELLPFWLSYFFRYGKDDEKRGDRSVGATNVEEEGDVEISVHQEGDKHLD